MNLQRKEPMLSSYSSDLETTKEKSWIGQWNRKGKQTQSQRSNSNLKDCEKVVRKYSITGQRFLNMSENDIQKFPKLSMPMVTKLSKDISRNEERRSIFPKRNHPLEVPQNTEFRQEEDDSWSSFESDDYETPDEQEPGVDYETPADEGNAEDENDGDYEPPPSNDDERLRNAIFPSKSVPAPSEYIDRAVTVKTSLPPPVPQRSVPPAVPAAHGSRPLFPSPSSQESNRQKNINTFKPPVYRDKKPPLNQPGPAFDRDLPKGGKRGLVSEMSLTPQLRSLGEELAKIQKPPVPSNDKHERYNPVSRRMLPPIQNSQVSERKAEVEDVNVPPRQAPQQPSQFFNTFPSRTTKPLSLAPKSPLQPKSVPDAFTESTVSSGGSLPSRLQPSGICRNLSKGPADSRSSLPVPNRQTTQIPNAECEDEQRGHKGSLNKRWFAADITRQEAEVALRNINQDGTFLVRNSSRKTLEQPYVLMVLYHDKVYNIQIRYQPEDQTYFLGTGLKGNEDFTSVGDIIDYFRKAPLHLIDGKDRGSRQQCTLTYAA